MEMIADWAIIRTFVRSKQMGNDLTDERDRKT